MQQVLGCLGGWSVRVGGGRCRPDAVQICHIASCSPFPTSLLPGSPFPQLQTAGSLGRKRKSSQLEAAGRRGSGQHEAAAQAAAEDREEARPKSGELGAAWAVLWLIDFAGANQVWCGVHGSRYLPCCISLQCPQNSHPCKPTRFSTCD